MAAINARCKSLQITLCEFSMDQATFNVIGLGIADSDACPGEASEEFSSNSNGMGWERNSTCFLRAVD